SLSEKAKRWREQNFLAKKVAGASAADVQKQSVKHQTQSGDEQERREILIHHGRNGDRQIHAAVSAREKINNSREQRVQKSAAHIFSAVRGVRSFRSDRLRNRFAAKRTVVERGPDGFSAIRTVACSHDRASLELLLSLSSVRGSRQAFLRES